MNIRNWPIDKIMQLPDFCFGRRWPVGVYATSTELGTYYDISEAGLGDRCVIWTVTVVGGSGGAGHTLISLALGDMLPTTDAQFDALEPLFSDAGRRGAVRRAFEVGGFSMVLKLPMRLPVTAQGRRLVGRIEVAAAGQIPTQAIMEVSSFPTEVPEWLISGQARGRW